MVEGIKYAGQLRERSGAEMPVVVSDEDLSKAFLDKTRLDYSVFVRCSFEGASFIESDLENAQFIGCNLRGTNFYKADLTGARFVNCCFDDKTWIDFYKGEWGFLEIVGCTYDYNGRTRQKEKAELEQMTIIENERG